MAQKRKKIGTDRDVKVGVYPHKGFMRATVRLSHEAAKRFNLADVSIVDGKFDTSTMRGEVWACTPSYNKAKRFRLDDGERWHTVYLTVSGSPMEVTAGDAFPLFLHGMERRGFAFTLDGAPAQEAQAAPQLDQDEDKTPTPKPISLPLEQREKRNGIKHWACCDFRYEFFDTKEEADAWTNQVLAAAAPGAVAHIGVLTHEKRSVFEIETKTFG